MEFLIPTSSLTSDPIHSQRYNVVDDFYHMNSTSAVKKTILLRENIIQLKGDQE